MRLNGVELTNYYGVSKLVHEKKLPAQGVIISHYQRPFRWTEEHISKLIIDWSKNKKKANQILQKVDIDEEDKFEYFCGSVVSVSNNKNAPYQLVDGQQRVTTLFLANYLLFLISKEIVYRIFRDNKKGGEGVFKEAYPILLKSFRVIFRDNQKGYKRLKDAQYTLERHLKIKATTGNNDPVLEDSRNECLKILQDILYINPTQRTNELETKKTDQRKVNSPFEGKKDLFLSYKRKGLNAYLRNVLRYFNYSLDSESEPKIQLIGSDDNKELNPIEESYFIALKCIFQNTLNLSIEETTIALDDIRSWEIARTQLNIINSLIEEIQFCVIQTNDYRDAFTLFEVLNDRALALDDLDLIKNIFYKNFVESNTNGKGENLSEEEVDNTLDRLDLIWSDYIYKTDMIEPNKKLITYFALTYITGDTTLKYSSTPNFRDALEAHFDKEVSSYSTINIYRDFNIFYSCSLLINSFGLKFGNKDLTALTAQYNIQTNIITNTFHFLNALEQFGVMSALVNLILRDIQDNTLDFYAKRLNCEDELFHENINNISNTLNEKFKSLQDKEDILIARQAKALWLYSMYTEDATKPRKFAQKIITRNNYDSTKATNIVIEPKELDELEKDFRALLEKWRYTKNQSKNSLKPRILFALLTQQEHNKDAFDNRSFEGLTDTEISLMTQLKKKSGSSITLTYKQCQELQLDHMEPDKYDESSVEDYFIHSDRDSIVNSLGNIMPIRKKENLDKGKSPLNMQSKKYYDPLFKNEFFNVLTFKLLGELQKNEQFFHLRKKLLINWFVSATKNISL